MSSIHLGEIGSIVLQVNGVMVESKNIKLINSIPADLPPLMGDEARIQKILYNLIGNAIKFTREGEIELGGKAERGELIVSIRDTGIGLSITRQIVHLHKGRIWLESTLGQGITSTISIAIA